MADDLESLGSLFDQAHAEATQQPEVKPETTEAPSRATLDYLAGRGFDVSNFQSDEDWLTDAEQFFAQRQAHEAEIADWQRNRDLFQQWQQSQQKPEPTPEVEPEPKKMGWQSPQVSETAMVLLENGGFEPHPTMPGLVKAKDPYMQRFADEVNQKTLFDRKKAKLIFDNPEKFYEETGLYEKLAELEKKLSAQPFDEEALLTKAEERLLKKIAQAHQQKQADEGFREYAPLLYQTDAQGQFLRNAAGRGVPTELGRVYEQAISNPPAYVHDTPEARQAYAMSVVAPQIEAARKQQEQAQTPQETRQAKQETWLNKSQTRNGQNRLSPDDARISEAARAAERNPNGHKKISDIWDEALQEAQREMR